MREQLEQLVETWREKAMIDNRVADDYHAGACYVGRCCAGELEALLRSAPPTFEGSAEQDMEAVRDPGPGFAQELSDAMNEGRWKDATFRLVWKVDAIYRLCAAKDAEIATLKGAMRAQDEREQRAGLACGVLWLAHGCDWPDAVAERVITLRQQLAELTEATLDAFSHKLRAQQAEAALAESRAEVERLRAKT